ncbi:nucleoside hydrolase [Halobacteriales archaeon QS_5_68_33]|nr:MAG: nucleoside hydrolase [Halobacteriales archaeon QS_5_68_33]
MTPGDLSAAERVRRLALPGTAGSVDLALDTDAYNEVDDQFAVAHALRSEHTVEALYAAPFHNNRSDGPADGMAKSYEEIGRVLDRLGESRPVFRGAERYMDGVDDPVESPAVADLLERAHADRDGPLYVVAIGAATNVASAIATDPSIREEVVVVWLGGTPHGWHTAAEFNLSQDVPAARVLFDSGVPLVHVPTVNVAEHVRTTLPELRALFGDANGADGGEGDDGAGGIGQFLVDRVAGYEGAGERAWSKVIWDLAATAVLATPGAVESVRVPSPMLTDGETWSHDAARHDVRVVRGLDRDAVFRDLVE